jgi:hypothetical protein
MSETRIWDFQPPSAEDQRLIDAYLHAGRTLDDLPYTPEFDGIIKDLGVADTLPERHRVLKRLLVLRKSGQLPRLGRSPSEAV